MVLDFIVKSLICTIWVRRAAHEFRAGRPDLGWKIFFAWFLTVLNLQDQNLRPRMRAWRGN